MEEILMVFNCLLFFAVQRRMKERLWHEFFSDPSQWWDHRSEKVNSRYPDFKHKTTQQALWLDGILTPPWVEAKLAAMAPRSIQPSVFQWNVRLARYVKSGQYEKTVDLFKQMKREGMVPDDVTFVHVLKACSSSQALKEGQHVHQEIVRRGCESNIAVGSRLIDMYAKCGRIEDAQIVFDRMPTRDVVSWTALILGYVKSGQGQKALQLLQQMQHEGVLPDRVTFVGLLNVCASVAALDEGRHVHKLIIQRGWESDAFVGSSLVDMYGKCGSIKDAERVFNSMSTRDVVCWTSMILGHVKCGQAQNALEVSQKMQQEGVQLNAVTFVGILNACARIAALEEGRHVHEQIVQNGFESNVFVSNSLIDMYAKCGAIEDAQKVFNKMPTHDAVSWTAMILGHMKCGQAHKALQLSHQMQREGVKPDHVTYVGLLNACANVLGLEEGKRVHEQIIQSGCKSDIFVSSSLIDMYAKCGSMEDALKVFSKMPRLQCPGRLPPAVYFEQT
jgi:pentatricopeptide repeat protein